MHHDIAFLHTSPLHVETFDSLVKSIDASLLVKHVVAEALLTEAQRVGAKYPALIASIQATMVEAASTGASIVVCTCSTIGGAAERTPTEGRFLAARIDRAMADRAVAIGPRILIIASAESTLAPTTDLINESAVMAGTSVDIQHLLIQGAWTHFLSGDREAYLREIVAAVRVAPLEADVVVLAQASMAPAAVALNDLGIEVLSSPLLGVQIAIVQLKELKGVS